MKTLAGFLSQQVLAVTGDNVRPVLDKTGLTGKYDFAFKFSTVGVMIVSSGADPSMGPPGTYTINSGGPTLFKALQDNLGLKLESGKGPVPVIVIDHVEKPSAN
ncbi:MAG: TIGR03435 family protein [Candidatus Acidiferrales bacterium]